MSKSVYSKLVGVTFNNRQFFIKHLEEGQKLFWKHDKNNKYDENAIELFADEQLKKSLGHLNKDLAKDFVNWKNQLVWVDKVTGTEKQTKGVNVFISCDDS